MPAFAFLGAFIPFLALVPPSLAAMWIANRWIKARAGGTEAQAELTALREEVAALRQAHVEALERLGFAERMLSQLREARAGLPKGSV